MEEETFKPDSHLKAIESAIEELGNFASRTAMPAPAPHQYIGTVVDNTFALLTFCQEQGIEVQSALQKPISKIISQIEEDAGDLGLIKEHLKELRCLLGRKHPGFDDYLNAVLKNSSLTKKEKSRWRKFFRALSIIRNKVLHSIPDCNYSGKIC